MSTKITFRRGTAPPTQASGLTLGEPAFDTTNRNLYIGLGAGITAAWVGAQISGSSADIGAGLTTWIPTASAVKDYVASNGGGLLDGDKGDIIVSGSGATLTVESVGGIRIGAATGGTNSLVFGIDTLAVSTGDGNVALGNYALDENTSGFYNTAVGHNALSGITSQFRCTAVGWNALSQNTGSRNAAVGSGALQNNTTGTQNVAFGNNTLQNNTKGNNNMGIGAGALSANSEGSNHVAIGAGAITNISATDSVNLIAIGSDAGRYLPNGTTGLTGASRCVYIGARVRGSTYGETNAIVIGDNLISNGSNTVLIGNTAMVSTTLNGLVDMAGGLSAAGATLSGNVTAPGGITFDGNISVNGTVLMKDSLSLRGGAIFITDSSGVIPPYTYINKNGVYATNSISIGSFAAHPVIDFLGYSTHGSCGGIIRFGVCADNGNIQTSLKGFIKNLSDPVETYDAANKNYVDNSTVTSFNGLTGAVSGVTVGGANTFIPLQSFSAGISAAGATFYGDIVSTGRLRVSNSAAITGDVTFGGWNFEFAPTLIFQCDSGATRGGAIRFGVGLGGNLQTTPKGSIENLKLPTSDYDAANKKYVDDFTVTSFNGLTGAVSGVTVGGVNTFTKTNAFNSGLCASGGITFGGDIFSFGNFSQLGSLSSLGPLTQISNNIWIIDQLLSSSHNGYTMSFYSGISSTRGGCIEFGRSWTTGGLLTTSQGQIKNLANPGETFDAANKNYVDNFTVTLFNGRTGPVGISAGANITITQSGNTFTIASTASGDSTNVVTSFNGLTGAVQGVSAAVAGNGISVSGATGAVTITNTGVTSAVAGTGIGLDANTGTVTITNNGVRSFNGLTGAVGISAGANITITQSGNTFTIASSDGGSTNVVTSFNGLTGAVTGVASVNGATGTIINVARTNTGNVFSGTQQFTDSSLGITAAVIQATELHTNTILPNSSAKHLVSILPRGAFGTDYNAPVQTGIQMLSFSESFDQGLITLRPAFKQGSLTGVTIDFPYNSGTVALTGENTFTGIQVLTAGLSAAGGITLASPNLTGVPTAPTATSGTNTTQIATTAFVRTEVSNLVDSAPTTLDTLNELAAALGDDPNFATTITNSLSNKAGITGDGASGTWNISITGSANSANDSLSLGGTAASSWALVSGTVTSFNGQTGAVSGVTVGGANVFTALNSFNSGVCANGITLSTDTGINIRCSASDAFANVFYLGTRGASGNVAIGKGALGVGGYAATINDNVAIGRGSIGQNTTIFGGGYRNVAIGAGSLFNGNNSRDSVVAIGFNAGSISSAGQGGVSKNVIIGASADVAGGDSNSIVIGADAIGDGSNSAVIGNSSTVSTRLEGAFRLNAPVTKTANFTLGDRENWIINNKSVSSCTVTLPAASSWTGRQVTFKNTQAQTLVSASSNVVPFAGGSAGTSILPATVGAWATIVSDGSNWIVMQGSV